MSARTTSPLLYFSAYAALYIIWCLFREQERPTLSGFLAASKVAGIMLLGGYGCVVWAQQTVPSSIAALIISIEPLWFVIFDWLFFNSRKPSKAETLGVALGDETITLPMLGAAVVIIFSVVLITRYHPDENTASA